MVLYIACFRVSFCAGFNFYVSRFNQVEVAEWPPFGKELLIRLTVCSLYIMFKYNFGYFPFWFRGQDFDSNCTTFWSLLTFLFYMVSCSVYSNINHFKRIARVWHLFVVWVIL